MQERKTNYFTFNCGLQKKYIINFVKCQEEFAEKSNYARGATLRFEVFFAEDGQSLYVLAIQPATKSESSRIISCNVATSSFFSPDR